MVHRRDGRMNWYDLTLDRRGNGVAAVRFHRGPVARAAFDVDGREHPLQRLVRITAVMRRLLPRRRPEALVLRQGARVT